jgi:hypothetical protein
MKWFEAWVTLSCIFVPAGSWVCAHIRETRRRRQPRLERAVVARDLELHRADSPSTALSFAQSSGGRRFIGVLTGLEGSLISERARARWPARE